MQQTKSGLAYGIGAYLLWGAFPFYFGLLETIGPLEIVPWRVVTTLILCLIFLAVTRRFGRLWQIIRNPKQFAWFTLSALLLYANWQIFVIGVMTGHVLETSLGYFINPLFTVLLGVFVRKEQLTRMQWWAVGIAAVAVTFSAIAYGKFPWIALGVATSFALYGAVHKHAGEQVDGVTGLSIETVATLPVALLQFIFVAATSGVHAFSFGGGVFALVLASGIMTAAPLVLFGEATRRLPLSYIGFLQFLTPVLGFLYGYFVTHEEVPLGRWVGFVGVWIALVLLVWETLRRLRALPPQEAARIQD